MRENKSVEEGKGGTLWKGGATGMNGPISKALSCHLVAAETNVTGSLLKRHVASS